MSESMMLFLFAQAITILAGILGSHVSTKTQIAELRGMVTQLQITATGLRNDHVGLSEKVDGISRHVAHIEGMEEARLRNGRCRYAPNKEKA